MKVLFIPSKYKDFSLKNIKSRKLPKIIGLVTTIQHTNQIKKVKSYLQKHKKKVIIGKSKNKNLEQGQILGCDIQAAISIKNKIQAFLYIGSGKFHALQIAIKTDKPIFIFNPLTQEFSKLSQQQIQKLKNKNRAQKLKFLSAQTFGILVSIKPGQNKLEQALVLNNKLEKKNKKTYIFIFNTLDINQLENYPQIECWINTACPGLSLEHPFIWINEI